MNYVGSSLNCVTIFLVSGSGNKGRTQADGRAKGRGAKAKPKQAVETKCRKDKYRDYYIEPDGCRSVLAHSTAWQCTLCTGFVHSTTWQCTGFVHSTAWQCTGFVHSATWQCPGFAHSTTWQCTGFVYSTTWKCNTVFPYTKFST